MPKLSDDQIKAGFADNSIMALSIDTAVFRAKHYDFRNPSLRGLNQFLGTDISVILAEVVVREMKRHVAEQTVESQRATKKALRSHIRRWRIQNADDIYQVLQIDASPDEKAVQLVEQFMMADGIVSVPLPAQIDTASGVLDRYFSSTPPFAKSSDKKHEFPDAFALASLEAWANDQQTKILCISPDKEWQSYCDASEQLVCIGDLDKALSFFNEAFQEIANAIVELWKNGAVGDYLDKVFRAFQYRLDDLNFNIDASTDTFFETEALEATLQHVDPASASDPVVISSDEDTVTFRVSVYALVSFRAMFYFYLIDGIDKDMVHLGSEEAEKEELLTFDMTITANREFEGSPVFEEVEVSRQSVEVDFGYVEVFRDENPEHPKY